MRVSMTKPRGASSLSRRDDNKRIGKQRPPLLAASFHLSRPRPNSTIQVTSAVPPIAEVQRTSVVVLFVPDSDMRRAKNAHYPIFQREIEGRTITPKNNAGSIWQAQLS
jgi:hypothetical protein